MLPDDELLDRLRRLRTAHSTLAAELGAAQRALRHERGESARLRRELELVRRERANRWPPVAPSRARG